MTLTLSKFLSETSETITLTYSSKWSDEDIPTMAQNFLENIAESKIVESTLGADRAYFRFDWKDYPFILHYEIYSQSCWIEAEGLIESFIVEAFYQIIPTT